MKTDSTILIPLNDTNIVNLAVTRTKVLWDVRNSKDSNDEAISALADSWGADGG